MNHPILLDFPERFETERLLVRAPQWSDGELVNEAIRESAEELRKWLPFARNIPSLEESESFVRKARLNFMERTDMVLHLFDKNGGAFVGSSGLHRIDWEARRFEIGYWIRSSRSGNGLMTEAVNGITAFAIRYLEANRIEIRCDSRNSRSASVAKRAGFTLEGVHRNWQRDVDGALTHTMVFAKVRGDEF
ncbi:GNAT family N-acetyltransferase [Paenibacillus sp. DMB20]|uniref:GNAT family N-acetyltransferase n=1 Tax=Paenibacillus sp. DMB20 TaxID=1642570 RepID=UPI0019100E11